jgi:RNase P subunit RPR2
MNKRERARIQAIPSISCRKCQSMVFEVKIQNNEVIVLCTDCGKQAL